MSLLNEYIDQLGMYRHPSGLLSLKTNSCMADTDEAVVILPDGRLLKCETIRDEDVFGHIRSGDADRSKKEVFKETFEYDRCNDCPLYPACILLKACPTKKEGSPEQCRRSIQYYSNDLVHFYGTEHSDRSAHS